MEIQSRVQACCERKIVTVSRDLGIALSTVIAATLLQVKCWSNPFPPTSAWAPRGDTELYRHNKKPAEAGGTHFWVSLKRSLAAWGEAGLHLTRARKGHILCLGHFAYFCKSLTSEPACISIMSLLKRIWMLFSYNNSRNRVVSWQKLMQGDCRFPVFLSLLKDKTRNRWHLCCRVWWNG